MKKVDLESLQVVEQSQQMIAGIGFNCFPGFGFYCGAGCVGFACA